MADQPRGLGDRATLRQRLSRLDEPHVAALNAYVRLMRRRLGNDAVPWFDPASGGSRARVLILLEAPGARAVVSAGRSSGGSGIVSADNDDATAANFFALREEAGLDATDLIHWNVVPWYIGGDRAIRSAKETDIHAGLPYLRGVLRLLPAVRVVVTMGRAAQIGWGIYIQRERSRHVVVPTAHPSPRALNRYPEVRDEVLASLRLVALILGEGKGRMRDQSAGAPLALR